MGPGKKWYQKTGWIIFWLIFFFPVGLFLMWKYTDWKKPAKITVSVFFALMVFASLTAPKLESIHLTADTSKVYDINQQIKIVQNVTPDTYTLSTDAYKTTGGKIEAAGDEILFTADEPGIYDVYAESSEIKSNTLTFEIEDKVALAEEKARKEQAKKAAEEVKEAQQKAEKAAAKKAAEEAKEVQQKTEEAAQKAKEADAAAQQKEEETAASEKAEEERIATDAAAQQKAAQEEAAQEEAARLQQDEQAAANTVYWVPNGEVYHSTSNCPSLSRSKTILSGSISESGKSRPCKRCY